MDPLPLTDEARDAMCRARDRAVAAGAHRADRHHILAAVSDAQGARGLFDAYGTDVRLLAAAVGHLAEGIPPEMVDPDAEEIIVAVAMAEARRLGQAAVGSEHVVIALLHDRHSLAGGLLGSLGLTRDGTREVVRYLHGLVPGWEPPGDDAGTARSGHMVLEAVEGAVAPDPSEHMAWMDAHGDDGSIGALHMVVGIGQTTEASGITVELIALEVRDALAILSWRARPDRPWLLGSPGVLVADDAGTEYRAMSTGLSGGEHGGSGEVTIVPSPPQAASRMTIEVTGFGSDERLPTAWLPSIRYGPATGSWQFEIRLRG